MCHGHYFDFSGSFFGRSRRGIYLRQEGSRQLVVYLKADVEIRTFAA